LPLLQYANDERLAPSLEKFAVIEFGIEERESRPCA
jgi:hypothetical protein